MTKKKTPAIKLVKETDIEIQGLSKKRKLELKREAKITRERAYDIATKLGLECHNCYFGPGDKYLCETDRIEIVYSERYQPMNYPPSGRDPDSPMGIYISTVSPSREVFVENYERVSYSHNPLNSSVKIFKLGEWLEEFNELWEIAENGAKTKHQKNLEEEIKAHKKATRDPNARAIFT